MTRTRGSAAPGTAGWPPPGAKPPWERDKQAVLIIHGIGEQRPMDTLRRFVRTVWSLDDAVKHEHARPGLWSKPDRLSDSFELRRLTTSRTSSGVRTDFYELYWAHLMKGTRIGQVWAWIHLLLGRSPSRVPARLRAAWVLSLLLVVALGALALNAGLSPDARPVPLPWWATSMVGVLSAGITGTIMIRYLGDAARYLHPAPDNIGRRQEIRTAGVELLEALHESGEYGRVVVVGHSLGSVIAYDVLTHAWPRYRDRFDESTPKLSSEHDRLAALMEDGTAETAHPVQRRYLRELQAQGHPWLVTDLVTLGSPLTYGPLILADDAEDFRRKVCEREMPTSPPVEDGRPCDPDDEARPAPAARAFTYERKGRRIPHHAAVFGPTRWTNIYFRARRVIQGDIISGPLARYPEDGRPLFGTWIHDVEVETGQRRGLLSHTLYWKPGGETGDPDHIRALREAIALDEPAPELQP